MPPIPLDIRSSFWPGLRLASVWQRPELVEGALLQLDIMGNSEYLCSIPEEPTSTSSSDAASTLNAYYGKIIERVHAYGGECLVLQQDSLVALWPTRAPHSFLANQTLATAALAATSCALALQQLPTPAELALQGFAPAVPRPPAPAPAAGCAASWLRQRRRKSGCGEDGLRLSVGCGSVTITAIGGHLGSQLVASGAAALEAAGGLLDCLPGQVVLSSGSYLLPDPTTYRDQS